MRSAAQSLYPHLPSAVRPEVKQRQPNIADALFPAWSREQKARDADQALWDRICDHNRQVLRQGLREARANIERGR
jgi:hypothetical protein